jgi:hypothetical protein
VLSPPSPLSSPSSVSVSSSSRQLFRDSQCSNSPRTHVPDSVIVLSVRTATPNEKKTKCDESILCHLQIARSFSQSYTHKQAHASAFKLTKHTQPRHNHERAHTCRTSLAAGRAGALSVLSSWRCCCCCCCCWTWRRSLAATARRLTGTGTGGHARQ